MPGGTCPHHSRQGPLPLPDPLPDPLSPLSFRSSWSTWRGPSLSCTVLSSHVRLWTSSSGSPAGTGHLRRDDYLCPERAAARASQHAFTHGHRGPDQQSPSPALSTGISPHPSDSTPTAHAGRIVPPPQISPSPPHRQSLDRPGSRMRRASRASPLPPTGSQSPSPAVSTSEMFVGRSRS